MKTLRFAYENDPSGQSEQIGEPAEENVPPEQFTQEKPDTDVLPAAHGVHSVDDSLL